MTSVWSPLMLVLPKNLLSFRATMDYYDYQHLLSTECLWSKQKRQHLHRQEAGKHATCGLGRGYISFYSPWSPHTSYKPTYSFPTRVREVLGPSRAAKVWDVGGGCLATGPESGYFISTLFYFHRSYHYLSLYAYLIVVSLIDCEPLGGQDPISLILCCDCAGLIHSRCSVNVLGITALALNHTEKMQP